MTWLAYFLLGIALLGSSFVTTSRVRRSLWLLVSTGEFLMFVVRLVGKVSTMVREGALGCLGSRDGFGLGT